MELNFEKTSSQVEHRQRQTRNVNKMIKQLCASAEDDRKLRLEYIQQFQTVMHFSDHITKTYYCNSNTEIMLVVTVCILHF